MTFYNQAITAQFNQHQQKREDGDKVQEEMRRRHVQKSNAGLNTLTSTFQKREHENT